MKKCMKSFISLMVILTINFIVLFFTATIIKATPSGEAYQIITNPGEDMATSVNINWHSDVDGSFLEYTTSDDTTFSNAIKINGECEPLDFKEKGQDAWAISGFSNRNICKASINELTPDTEYIYHVGKNNFSAVYSFKTANNTGTFSFISMADPQFYATSGAEVWYDLLEDAYEIQKNISFTLLAGDVVNNGGDGSQWDLYFNAKEMKKGVFASSTGNHEYTDANSNTNSIDNRFYNAHNNNPQNGVDTLLNSTYYFKYNNALFIILDSQKTESGTFKSQIDWFCKVIEENPTQFIIVVSHVSIYGAASENNSIPLRNAFQPYFDKYGVDLVITGHDHIYTRSHKIYNGEITKEKNKGTIYITAGCAGSGTKYTTDNLDKNISAKYLDPITCYGIVTVSPASIIYRCYDKEKSIMDTVTINAKRNNEISTTDFNKDDFLNGLAIDSDEDDKTKAQFSWPTTVYGNVKNISLYNENNELIEKRFIYTNMDNYFKLSDLEKEKTLNYRASVEFSDGTIKEKDLILSTKMTYGEITNIEITENDDFITLKWRQNLKEDYLSGFKIYNGTKLIKELPISSRLISFDIYNVDLIEKNDFHICVVVEDTNEIIEVGSISHTVRIVPKDIFLDKDSYDLLVEEIAKINANIEPYTDEYTVLYSSSDENICTVDELGNIKAIKEGNAIITVKIKDLDISKVVNVSIKAKEITIPTLTVSKESISLEVGNGETIIANSSDSTYTISMTSSNPNIATVNESGYVMAVGKGTATITVKINNTDVTKTISVEVKEIKVPDPITPPVIDPDPVDPEPTEGCNSGSILVMLSLFGLAFTFFRRKKF